ARSSGAASADSCAAQQRRVRRQLSESPARVLVTCLDRAVEGVPVEHVDLREGGLEDEVRLGAVRNGARVAVDHAGAPENLKNGRALAPRLDPPQELPGQRNVDLVAAGAESPVGAADIATDHRATAEL